MLPVVRRIARRAVYDRRTNRRTRGICHSRRACTRLSVAGAGQLFRANAGGARPWRRGSKLRGAHLRARRSPNVAPNYHVGLRVDVSGGRLALQTLAAPVEDIDAKLEVVDNAFFVRGARAMLAGIPLHMTGGAYDFTGELTGRAQLQLAVWGDGDLSGLRRAFTFAHDQPISGLAKLRVSVRGPVDDPVILAQVNAAHASYRAMPFDSLAASVAYHSNVVALAPIRVGYGGTALRVHGTLQLGRHIRSEFALHLTGPADRLPYLNEMLGKEPIVVDARATGNDLLFHVAASAASALGVQRLAAMLEMNPNGTARVAPFWFHTPRGDLDGGYLLDRPHDSSAFWLVANRLRMRVPSLQSVSGVPLPECRRSTAAPSAMSLAGGGAGKQIALAGTVNGSDASIAGVKFDKVHAAFGGTLQNAAINRLRANGPWGTFDGHGDFSAQRFAAFGSYRGTFEGLQPFLTSAIPAHGGVGGTVGVAIEPQRIVVLGSNLTMQRATLRSVPVERANLTMAIEGNRLRIYSADARCRAGRCRRCRHLTARCTRERRRSRRAFAGSQEPESGAAARHRASTELRHAFGLWKSRRRIAAPKLRWRRRDQRRTPRAVCADGERRRAPRGRCRFASPNAWSVRGRIHAHRWKHWRAFVRLHPRTRSTQTFRRLESRRPSTLSISPTI